MAILFAASRFKATDTANEPISGAFLAFYATQTSTFQPIYADASLSPSAILTNPVKADDNGLFPEIWLDDDTLPPYKVVFSFPDINTPANPGAVIWTILKYNIVADPAAFVDTLFPLIYFQTQDEINAAVTPTDYRYAAGDVLRYGADPTGVTPSDTAFAQAFSVKGRITAKGIFKIGTTLTLDAATTSLIGDSAVINSTLTTGAVINVTSTAGDEQVAKNEIRGIQFVGTLASGVYALNIQASSPHQAAQVNIVNCAFGEFTTCVRIFTQAFSTAFRGCAFYSSGASGCVWVPAAGSNYGEKISFDQCSFYNNIICLLSDYQSCQFHLTNCSLDYSNQICVMNQGWALFSNCYIENNLDVAHWFEALGSSGATILLDQCVISQTGSKPNFEIFNAASSTGALQVRNSKLYTATNNATLLCAGTGNAFARGNTFEGGQNPGAEWSGFSARSNLLPAQTFTSLTGWTIGSTGSGGNPTVVSGALVIQVAQTGSDQFAYIGVTGSPGENIALQFQAKTNNAAAIFAASLEALGADGSSLGSNPSLFGANVFNGSTSQLTTSYVTYRASYTNLPAGTATIRVRFSTNGAANSAISVSVTNVIASKY